MPIPPQVRSIMLDERVWERSVVALFVGLGNACANAAWEENIGAPHDPPPGAAAAAAAALDAASSGCAAFAADGAVQWLDAALARPNVS